MRWEHTSVNVKLNVPSATPGTPSDSNSLIVFGPFANLMKVVNCNLFSQKYTYTQNIVYNFKGFRAPEAHPELLEIIRNLWSPMDPCFRGCIFGSPL